MNVVPGVHEFEWGSNFSVRLVAGRQKWHPWMMTENTEDKDN